MTINMNNCRLNGLSEKGKPMNIHRWITNIYNCNAVITTYLPIIKDALLENGTNILLL